MPMLRDLFPNGRFNRPAMAEEICEAEKQLGITIPDQLKVLYLESDGFREDKGNAKYLLSLTEDDSICSLVSITKHMWTEFEVPDFKGYVFFGSSAADKLWGLSLDNRNQIIAYHYSMEDEFEIVGLDILNVYLSDYKIYEELT